MKDTLTDFQLEVEKGINDVLDQLGKHVVDRRVAGIAETYITGSVSDQDILFWIYIKKHYGDVLASTVVLEFPDTSDTNAVCRLLAQHRLKGNLEVAKIGFAFWNPDDGHYKSQTTPK